mmetsp:Transcript_53911/g.107309  ORF Transcript_53911/g.107309 Transcript_53911/m.107309 type:complete len:242 (-) Transcript_53911:45-770(-)
MVMRVCRGLVPLATLGGKDLCLPPQALPMSATALSLRRQLVHHSQFAQPVLGARSGEVTNGALLLHREQPGEPVPMAKTPQEQVPPKHGQATRQGCIKRMAHGSYPRVKVMAGQAGFASTVAAHRPRVLSSAFLLGTFRSTRPGSAPARRSMPCLSCLAAQRTPMRQYKMTAVVSTETSCRHNTSKQATALVFRALAPAFDVVRMALLKMHVSKRHSSTISSRVKIFGAGLRQGDAFWLHA